MNFRAIGLSCFARTSRYKYWLTLSFSFLDVIHEFKIAAYCFLESSGCPDLANKFAVGSEIVHVLLENRGAIIVASHGTHFDSRSKASPDFHSSYFVASHDKLVVAVEAGSSSQSQ